MQKLLIASGETTKERIFSELSQFKKVFNTEQINFCSSEEELSEKIDDADTLVFYSDFPLPYSTVRDRAKQSKEVSNIIGVEYSGENKMWVYDGDTVANCVMPHEEVSAIKRAISVPKYVNLIGQLVAGVLLFCFILGAAAYSHQIYMALNQRIEATQTEDTSELN